MRHAFLALFLTLALTCAAASAAPSAPSGPIANAVRISQVYGGGGNSGATLKNDFIELFNSGTTAVSLAGWSVQYASATGTTWQVTILSGSIAPGAYYLIQEAQGAGGTTDLPTPDAIGVIAMSASNGKVALVSSATALSGICPTGLVDLVGYGTANCSEGPAALALSNTTAALRVGSGCQDTDSNAADFASGAPTPRNSSAPTTTCGGDAAPSVTGATPADQASNVALTTHLTVSFSESVAATASAFALECPVGAPVGVTQSAGPATSFTLTPGSSLPASTACRATVYANQISDSDANDPPDNLPADYTWTFTTAGANGVCGDPATLIHALQGSGTTSPLLGQAVIIEGLVVGDYQTTTTELGGFYIQEEAGDADADPATSEGVFVYDNNFGVDVVAGDTVRVNGTVAEFTPSGYTRSLTQVKNLTNVTLCSSGHSVAPTPVTLPAADAGTLERYEGMLVSFPQELTVTDNFTLGRYGEVGLAQGGRLMQPTNGVTPGPDAVALQAANNLRKIVLDDGNGQQNRDPILYPAPGGLTAVNTLRGGDTVTGLTGVLDQRFDVYRVQPVGAVPFVHSNARPAVPAELGGTLKVAAGNVLNYFTTIDPKTGASGYICGPLHNQECRGADSAQEFTRQQTKIVAELKALDADVVGLMEIENDSSDTPLQTLVNTLNTALGAPVYALIPTGALGSDAIRVGLLYKTASVAPVGSFLADGDPIHNRPPLAQTFRQHSNGARFSVVVNHFKSKGCSGATGLDQDQGDGQGCWNALRQQQATRLLSFIDTVVVPTSGDPDVLIVGDLNSYAREDPITLLKAGGYRDLIAQYEGPGAYSYAFGAQYGYLDHALASAPLQAQVVGVTHWANNADEPVALDYNQEFKSAGQVASLYAPDAYRAADHDPLLLGLRLLAPSIYLPLIAR